MENFKERIQIIRDHYFRMMNLANFCIDTHFSSRCKRKKYEYKIFAKDLKRYQLNTEKPFDEKKNFFIVFCMNNKGASYKFFNLAVKKYIPKEFEKKYKENYEAVF